MNKQRWNIKQIQGAKTYGKQTINDADPPLFVQQKSADSICLSLARYMQSNNK